MAEQSEVLTTFSRHATKRAKDALSDLGFASTMLAAVLVEAGGSIDIGYEAMGQGALHDIEVVRRDDNLGVTVRVAAVGSTPKEATDG